MEKVARCPLVAQSQTQRLKRKMRPRQPIRYEDIRSRMIPATNPIVPAISASAGPTPMANRKHLIRVATEADLQAVAQIHIASWQDAYKGIIPDALLAGRSVEGFLSGWRSTFAKHPANINVAASQVGGIQGFCCAGPVVDAVRNSSFAFEIYGLHVSPNSRRQGIGAALLRDAFARARDRERMNSAIVWTLSDLRLSRTFYEREGGKVVKSGLWTIGEFALPEVAYGWTSLHSIQRAD